jgi:hypothetical protein
VRFFIIVLFMGQMASAGDFTGAEGKNFEKVVKNNLKADEAFKRASSLVAKRLEGFKMKLKLKDEKEKHLIFNGQHTCFGDKGTVLVQGNFEIQAKDKKTKFNFDDLVGVAMGVDGVDANSPQDKKQAVMEGCIEELVAAFTKAFDEKKANW